MASLNKVQLIGNLGKDPEVRYTQQGTAVASLSLATTSNFKNKDGVWEDRTEWHRVTLWGRLAELSGEYLAKGKAVYIEGRLQTREYEKDGSKRYSTEVVGEQIQFLSPKPEKAIDYSAELNALDATYPPVKAEQQAVYERLAQPEPSKEELYAAPPGVNTSIEDDDIPF